MSKISKILILLAIPLVLSLINFLPERHGIFMHPIQRYTRMFLVLFPFTLLPYLASRKYKFELKKFIKILLISIVVFIVYTIAMWAMFHNYLGGPPREAFVLLVPLFVWMVAKEYRYTHYFFFFFMVYTFYAYIGRYILGYYFPLSFGFVMIIPTYTFYTTYILSEQYLKMQHKTALIFAFSFLLVALGGIVLDVSYIYVRELDFVWLLKEYGSYDTLFIGSITLLTIGTILFFYGIYLLYREKSKEEDRMKITLIKSTLVIMFINILAYLTILVMSNVYSTSYDISVFDNVHFGFYLLLMLFISTQIKQSYSFLLGLFLIVLVVGFVELNFFMDYMETCSVCHSFERCNFHECGDSNCHGWYSLQDGRGFFYVSYLFTQTILFALLFFIKVISLWLSRSFYEKNI